jgi:hypothetical protein
VIQKLINSVWNKEELPDQWKESVKTSHRAILHLATKQSTALFSPGTLRPISGPARHGAAV